MGWVGNIILIISVWLVGSKNRAAFVFGAFGNALWTAIGWQKGMLDLTFIGIVMVIFNIRGWIKWSGENSYMNSMLLPKYRIKWWQIWK
jgi:hypothetical protein